MVDILNIEIVFQDLQHSRCAEGKDEDNQDMIPYFMTIALDFKKIRVNEGGVLRTLERW